MSDHSGHDDYDEEMQSSESYGDDISVEFSDSEEVDADDMHQIRTNYLEHLRSSTDPHARQLAQMFQAVMPGFEQDEEGEEEGDSANGELGPLLAHLRNMRRRMFHPVTGPLAGLENDDLGNLLGEDDDDEYEVITGPMRNVSRIRLVRLAMTLANNPNNDGVITQALHQLDNVILLTEQEEFGDIVPTELVEILIKILDDSQSSPMILVLVTRTIAHMVEANDATVVKMFIELNLLDAIKERIADLNYIDVAEQAVTVLHRVVQRYPGEVMASGCVQNLLSYADFFNVHLQRSIANILQACAAGINDSRFDDALKLMTGRTPDPVMAKGDPVADAILSAYAQLYISMGKHVRNRDRLRTFFNEDYSGTVANVFMLSATYNAPHLGSILKALTVITSLRTSAPRELFENKFSTKVAAVLTELDFCEPVDSQQVLPKLLNTPKENISAALGLFTTMLPNPRKFDNEPVSPFRKDSETTPNLNGVDDELLRFHGNVVSRLAASIYAASTDHSIREQILMVMLQVSTYIQGDIFEDVANAIDYPSFLASVLSQADAPITLVVGALELVYEIGKKLPHKYLAAFTRRGVLSDLEEAQQNKVYFGKEYTPALNAVIKRVRDLYSEYPEYSYNNDGAEASDLVNALLQGQGNYSELGRVIREYSSLELMKFGVFEVVIKLLESPSSREATLDGLTPVLATLVDKAQDALSHGDKLGLLSSSSTSTVQSFASALTRPVNIRLHASDDDRAWTLRVQGIAAIEAVEDFYRARMLSNFPNVPATNLFSVLADNAQNAEHAEGENDQNQHNNEDHEEGDDEDDEDVGLPGAWPDSAQMSGPHRFSNFGLGFDGVPPPMPEYDDFEDSSEEERFGLTIEEEEDRPSYSKKPKLYCYLNGQRVYSDMSVVGAIYKSFSPSEGDNVIPKSLWMDTFDIVVSKRRLPETKTEGSIQLGRGRSIEAESVAPNEVPASLSENEHFSTALKLLTALWTINNTMLFSHPRRFVNSILTAKLNRQLEDPLVVVSSILPQWTVDAVRLYPFLFPFETRYMFIQSTSFGYSRCMSRWQTRGETGEMSDLGPQGALSPFQATAQAIARTGVLNNAGRPVKQKFIVARDHLFEEFKRIFRKIGKSPAIVEVEFEGEAGTGLGPTQEFYAKVSQEFVMPGKNMWLGQPVNGFMHHNQGLFPRPSNKADLMEVLAAGELFKHLGRFISRALLDQRILDFRLNPAFFIAVLQSRGYLQSTPLSLRDVDTELYENLHKLEPDTVESLELAFVLPGFDNIEVYRHGKEMCVTADNLEDYKQQVEKFMLVEGIKCQVDRFVSGFSENLPLAALQALLPAEICQMCGQSNEDWTVETLTLSLNVDHGYTPDSPAIKNLIVVMSGLSPKERRAFLQFTTGSPNLPIGGFKALQPPFTVVLKHPENEKIDRDQYLPSVMTCANYLKLPNYSSRAVMARQIRVAVEEGSDSFQLS